MTSPQIILKDVHFKYRTLMRSTTSFRSFLSQLLRGKLRLNEFQAISNLDLQVSRGEVVSIIGKNGAGKSTLLKLIAGVLSPNSGTVRCSGTLAPMIELGAGFHPEMTAAENVLFYSTLIGHDIKDTKKVISDICEWAGLKEQMNHPLRTFSSGMIARLAFATSTFVQTDILLIDEILSVGDIDFQRKSKNRIRELIANGTSVILVSHDLQEVLNLSDKVIWLDRGKIRFEGDPKVVVGKYLESTEESSN